MLLPVHSQQWILKSMDLPLENLAAFRALKEDPKQLEDFSARVAEAVEKIPKWAIPKWAVDQGVI